jgi:hypothetical protein
MCRLKFDAKRKDERLRIEEQAYLDLKAESKTVPKTKKKSRRTEG